MKRSLALFLFVVSLGVSSFAQDAVKLNTIGFNHYKQKEYNKAVEYFRKSIEKDPLYFYPRYNLACTLSIIIDQELLPVEEGRGEYSFRMKQRYLDEAFENLEKSVALYPVYMPKIKKDPDLDYLRGYYRYYSIIAYCFSDPDNLRSLLRNISVWSIPGQGVFNLYSQITFSDNGTVNIVNLDWDIDSLVASYRKVTAGTYKVTDQAIIEIHFEQANKAGKRDFKAALVPSSREGLLYIEGVGEYRPNLGEAIRVLDSEGHA